MKLLKRAFFWVCWPALFVYFVRSHRSRVIIRCGQDTLLVKGWWEVLYADAAWGLPGGGVARGEDPAAGAARELHEELGLTLDPDQLVPLGEALVSDRGIRYRAHLFVYELADRQLAVSKGFEIRTLRWLTLDGLPPGITLKPEVRIGRQLLGDR